MADVIHKNFEHNAFETDIQKLGKEISEKKILPEHKDVPEREIIRKTIYQIAKQQTQPQQQTTKNQQPEIQNQILPDYLKNSSADIKNQVEKLIDFAISHGIEKAIKMASQSSAFVVDAFHDAITDKLYNELKNRKIL